MSASFEHGEFEPREMEPRIRPDVLLRTRRAVMEAALEMQARRARQRRNAGFALLAIGVLVLLLAPLLWELASNLTSGERFYELPTLVLTLSLVLLSGVLGVLLVTWSSRRSSVHDE